MSIATRRQPSAFSVWLRTGLWPEPLADSVEHKFNPYHDPTNGRFTFAPGGGSFGGSGATGSWESGRHAKPPEHKPKSKPNRAIAKPAVTASSAVIAAIQASDAKSTGRSIVKSGYTFHIDKDQRTTQVSGTITLNDAQTRSRGAQAAAGGADRLSTDDGGHYIARRFNGPTDAFNHFAQDSSFNRGSYRALEDRWAKATARGQKVSVTITPTYTGALLRPTSISVSYVVVGIVQETKFPNKRQERPHEK